MKNESRNSKHLYRIISIGKIQNKDQQQRMHIKLCMQ